MGSIFHDDGTESKLGDSCEQPGDWDTYKGMTLPNGKTVKFVTVEDSVIEESDDAKTVCSNATLPKDGIVTEVHSDGTGDGAYQEWMSNSDKTYGSKVNRTVRYVTRQEKETEFKDVTQVTQPDGTILRIAVLADEFGSDDDHITKMLLQDEAANVKKERVLAESFGGVGWTTSVYSDGTTETKRFGSKSEDPAKVEDRYCVAVSIGVDTNTITKIYSDGTREVVSAGHRIPLHDDPPQTHHPHHTQEKQRTCYYTFRKGQLRGQVCGKPSAIKGMCLMHFKSESKMMITRWKNQETHFYRKCTLCGTQGAYPVLDVCHVCSCE